MGFKRVISRIKVRICRVGQRTWYDHEAYDGIVIMIMCKCGPGSSVGIATDYGLDGSGSNPGGDEIFRPSRPALRPTQPSVKRVPGLSWG